MTDDEKRYCEAVWAECQRLTDRGQRPTSKSPPFNSALDYKKLGYTPIQAARFYMNLEHGPSLQGLGR